MDKEANSCKIYQSSPANDGCAHVLMSRDDDYPGIPTAGQPPECRAEAAAIVESRLTYDEAVKSGAARATTPAQRQAAVNFARASLGLEGFKPSEAAEQKIARFIAEEIDLAEFVKRTR